MVRCRTQYFILSNTVALPTRNKNCTHAPVLNTEIDMAELQQHKDNLHACALIDTVLIDLTSTSIDVKGMHEKVESSFNPTAKKSLKYRRFQCTLSVILSQENNILTFI